MNSPVIASVTWDDVGIAAINFAFIAVLGGAVGLGWGALRHRRELDLAALTAFREAFGRWNAVWRGWSAAIEAVPLDEQHTPPIPVEASVQLDLMRRAADVEASFDALLVKIALERRLGPDQIRRLGRFREGYQQLRESIEKRQEVPFRVRYDADNVAAYLAFKALTVEFAALLSEPFHVLHSSTWRRPSLLHGQEAFIQVTSWRAAADSEHSGHKWWNAKSDEDLRADLVMQLHKLRL